MKALLPLIALLLTSCGGDRSQPPVEIQPPIRTDQPLRPGDEVGIQLTDFPGGPVDFSQKIPASGTLKLLHNQSFTTSGKLASELEEEIRNRYVPDYYERMLVIVRANNEFFYVQGQVGRDGRYPYSSGMTILKAVATAGGFTPFARTRAVKLLRANGKSYTINCQRAETDRSLDVPIYPGDQIKVPRRLY
tara:strand:- start:15260 stop:15832 length:573 start_codon:yes stop_codon:yes gene_type:complete